MSRTKKDTSYLWRELAGVRAGGQREPVCAAVLGGCSTKRDVEGIGLGLSAISSGLGVETQQQTNKRKGSK